MNARQYRTSPLSLVVVGLLVGAACAEPVRGFDVAVDAGGNSVTETSVDVSDVSDPRGDDGPDVRCTGPAEANCGGVCRDLTNDPANCGACGHTCRWGCAASACNHAVQISAGAGHNCALLDSGGAVCWGDNTFGEIGDGNVTTRLVPLAVAGLTDAVEITAGGLHTCARRASGAVVCWGRNFDGQLGDGTSGVNRPTAVAVTGLSDAVEVAAGGAHTCARRAAGTVVCWGASGNGALGDGSTTHSLCGDARTTIECSPTPVVVVGLSDAVEIVAGGGHTCARRASGAVVCWGSGVQGQLGDGTSASFRAAPVNVTGLTDAVELAAGATHTCARRASGEVVCWGFNLFGQIGDGTRFVDRLTPTAVASVTNAVGITAAIGHSCARVASGGVVCWGDNNWGEIGDGTHSPSTPQPTPVAVAGVTDAIDLAAAGAHTCALRPSGVVVCWGRNSAGELGDGSVTHEMCGPDDCSPAPVVVAGL